MEERKTVSLDRQLAWVVPQNGALEGNVYPVFDSGTTLGTGDRVHIRLRGYQGVAALHARMIYAGRWELHVLGDAATRVDDHVIGAAHPVRLEDGQPIELGTCRLTFKCL